MIEWILIVIVLILFFALLSMGISAFGFAPWVPTKTKDLSRVAKLCDLKEGDIFIEIGCGNGRVCKYLNKNSNAKIIGIERAWPLALISKFRLRKNKKVKIIQNDFKKTDISKADVIFTFGMPEHLKKTFAKKIEQECKSGTRIISYVFKIPQWNPDVVDKQNEKDLPIYHYTIK